MANKACMKELNAQLQALDARLRATQKQVNTLADGLAAVAGSVALQMVGPFAEVAGRWVTMAGQVGGAFSTIFMAISNLTAPSINDFMEALVLQAAAEAISKGIEMADSVVAAVNQEINQQLSDARQALADAIEQGLPTDEAEKLVNQVTDKLDTVNDIITKVKNLSKCKSGGSIIS